MALALVMASGLLVRSFYQLLASDSGFRADHVLTFELSLSGTRYPERAAIARSAKSVTGHSRNTGEPNLLDYGQPAPYRLSPIQSVRRLSRRVIDELPTNHPERHKARC
jgi:hypothetical protein